MKYIKQYEFVSDNKQLIAIIKNLGVSPLYHAIKSPNAIKALQDDKLGGYSIQRAWENGKRYKDDQPEYEDSFFMRGISTSRDIEYCSKWNDVIFVFDTNKLKTKYKVIPYNWGYNIGRGYNQGARVKREREEFIITGYSHPKDNEDEDNNRSFMDMIKSPEGYIEPLSKYLLGFFISERFEEYMDENSKNYLQSHKKYLGVYGDYDTVKNKKISVKDKISKIFKL